MTFLKFLSDFIIGGSMIAVVIAIGSIFTPFLAGIMAVLPLKLAITLFLGGVSGETAFVAELVEGGLMGSIGAVVFVLTLAGTTKRYGVWRSFALSWTLCILTVLVVMVFV